MEKELKTLLRKLAAEYETKDFINDDPVRFVHAYADKQDMEIVGFIASWLAYGNRKVIVSTIQALINEMNYLSSGSPFVFIVERRWEQMEHLKDAASTNGVISTTCVNACMTFTRTTPLWNRQFANSTTKLRTLIGYNQCLTCFQELKACPKIRRVPVSGFVCSCVGWCGGAAMLTSVYGLSFLLAN